MKIAVLTGGVGGAKFVLGLAACSEAGDIAAIVNTGDDFRHMGLHVSPDIDTLLYTLSGKANRKQGWGREGESWSFMAAARSLGAPDWFALGDGDLALHVLRSEMLAGGASLSTITEGFARAWGIGTAVLPMSNEPVATIVDTDEGELSFQRYFVERRCAPRVKRIRFAGAQSARPAPGVAEAIGAADVVFIAPSNPYLSVDPILAVPGIGRALAGAGCPVVVISPLVGGQAVKGPTAKIMAELGVRTDNDAIAAHYASLATAMLHDHRDRPPAGLPARATDTLMNDLDDKRRVAAEALALARVLRR